MRDTTRWVLGSGIILLSLLDCAPIVAQSAAATPTEYFRVEPWRYWAATPAYTRMCSAAGHCYSNVVGADRHILGFQDNGIYGITAVLAGGGIGVTRDYVGGVLRCFSDAQGACTPIAVYPPEYAPAVDVVPVLDAASLGTTHPTANAKLYLSARTFQVNIVSTSDCSVSYSGPVTQSAAHFVLSSLDLGAGVGVLPDVYVQEFYSGIPVGASDPRYGARMERYFFAPGLGRVRQEGWDDPVCTSDPATCTGNYTIPDPVAGVWVPADGPAAPIAVEICP